jgi:D-beta-D-heptose 7-phosphate kinase/D-beta-D-heptose 1-phosphate adenosyltransferase
MMISLPKFNDSSILVIGDLMLDTYWHGPTDRISPEAPVPIVNIKLAETRAGGAANVALNIASLGSLVSLIGFVGKDKQGDKLIEILDSSNVNSHLISIVGASTINKLRIVARQQQVLRLDFEEEFPASLQSALIEKFVFNLPKSDIVVLSDYAKGTLVNAAKLIELANHQKKVVIVDPKGSTFDKYKGSFLLTPNVTELKGVVGSWWSEEELTVKATRLIQNLEIDHLLLTRSEKGMTLFSRNTPPINIQSQAQEVFDVTGAGDTVIATLAAALASGAALEDSVRLANYAAGVVVGKLGTSVVTLQELEIAISKGNDPLTLGGILDQSQVKALILKAKAKKQKVVMTNGCFDILHIGHIEYLKQARSKGDLLFVAVNSDNSVRRLKGAARPINTLQDRMLMLSSLQFVDGVVSFDEDTPELLYSELLPDLIVKGGDYSLDQIAGSEAVKAAGGEVLVIPFVTGYSTTNVIERILSDH